MTIKHLRPGLGDLSGKDRQDLIERQGEDRVYILTEKLRAKVVCSAVGGLVEPRKWPDEVLGREEFKGDIFHSARWDYNVNLQGKDILVIGTGCSAAQFVPKLTKPPLDAKSVTQLMRSPPWVVERIEPPMSQEKWAKWAPRLFRWFPFLANTLRTAIFIIAETDYFRLFGTSAFNVKQRKRLEKNLLQHLQTSVPEKYHEILTPNYSVACKRRIFDANWFSALNDTKIELSTLPLTRLKPQSVVLGSKRMYPPETDSRKLPTETEGPELPVDVIILANGFEVAQWFHPLEIKGRGGRDLIDVMTERGGPQAYQGTAIDGFPNFFIIFGPNTATGHSSVILASENMVNYSLKFIRLILNGDASTIEVKQDAEISYTRRIQKRLKNTVWMKGGCSSWYFTADGWNSTVLP